MGILRRWLTKAAIALALRRKEPDKFVLSDSNNFMLATLLHPKYPDFDFIVDEVVQDGVVGKFWVRQSYGDSCCLSNEVLNEGILSVIRRYKGDVFEYRGPYQVIAGELALVPLLRRVVSGLQQRLFNTRTILRSERIEVLKTLCEYSLKHATEHHGQVMFEFEGIDAMTICQSKQGVRIWRHPVVDRHFSELVMNLESLVASGDVEKVGINYRATPRAILTLSNHEEIERRHTTNKTQTWCIVVLTLVAALAAAIQAWAAWRTIPPVPPEQGDIQRGK